MKEDLFRNSDNRQLVVDPNFRLYLQTEDPLPDLDAKLCASTSVVSFVATTECAMLQLLSRAFEIFNPEQSPELRNLQQQTIQLNISMDMLETKLLDHICTACGSIQEDLTGDLAQMGGSNAIDWVSYVADLEQIDNDIGQQATTVTQAAASIAEIEAVQLPLEASAQRAALLYNAVQALVNLDRTYLFSYESFSRAFDNCIDDGASSKTMDTGEVLARCHALVAHVTEKLYQAPY